MSVKRLLGAGVLVFTLGMVKFDVEHTRGYAEVVLVETKAKKIEENRAEVQRAKAELLELEAIGRERLARLNAELAKLMHDRDAEMAELRAGLYCSECKRPKTQIEREENETFAHHISRVKGRALPASKEMLDAIWNKYLLLITRKRAEILVAEKDPAVVAKRASIKKLEDETERLCREITAHSRAHGAKVLAQVRSDQKVWARDLMVHVNAILIARDRVDINEARLAAFDRQFTQQAAAAREKVRQETASQKAAREGTIAANEGKAGQLQQAASTETAQLESRATQIRGLISALDGQLADPKLDAQQRTTLTTSRGAASAELKSVEQRIQALKVETASSLNALRDENQRLNDEIFDLTSSQSKREAEEVAKLKLLFDQKKAAATQAITTAQADAANGTATFNQQVGEYDQRKTLYFNVVVEESNRILTAAQRVSCPVFNDAREHVVRNWNSMLPCIRSHLQSKPYNNNVFGAYCTGEFSTWGYLGAYRSFLGGLMPADRQAVEKGTNPMWLEKLMNP